MVDRFAALTPRQTEITRLLTEGLNNKEIAFALGVSVQTVKNHLTGIFAKTGALDRTQLAYWLGLRDGGRPPLNRPGFDELPLRERVAIAADWLRGEGPTAA